MRAPNPVLGPIEWLLLVTLSVLWGGAFFCTEIALVDLPPFTVVLARVALAALALNIVLRLCRRRLPASVVQWQAFFAMGALNNLIPFSLIVWGQTQIGSGLAAILVATTPLVTVVLASLLTDDERLTAHRLIGAVLGLLGVTVMVGPAALGGLGPTLLAQLAVLSAAVSYAVAGIFGRRFRDLSPLVTATGQLTATTLMLLPITLLVDRPWRLPMPSIGTVLALLGLALLGTALAYLLYFRILATAGATNVLLVTFMVPIIAILLGLLVLSEALGAGDLAGLALIALSLATVDGRPLRPLRSLRASARPAR